MRLLNPLPVLFRELIAPDGGFGLAMALALCTLLTLGFAATVEYFLALADLVVLAGLVVVTDLTALPELAVRTTLLVGVELPALVNPVAVVAFIGVADLAEFGDWARPSALWTIVLWMPLGDLAILVVKAGVGVRVALDV